MGPKRDGPSRRGRPRRRIDVTQTPVPERERLFSECSEDQCSVCWNDIKIFAVGFCNHTVCYQCITRMRVLCSQNECAICRQDMPKVILTNNRVSFGDFDDKVMLMERRHHICFEDEAIKRAFEELLQFVCPICQKDQPVAFRTFKQLDQHVRREHELFYCELCSDNLKIFPHERKLYGRSELATHRRKGDPDDSSHRGHPLCQFCEVRYVDDDELFRHLRRDHFFCHFCDADGIQEYYPDYTDLKAHFKHSHFLCEENSCINERFTHAFRTELDMKAHRAERHSGAMSKSEAKMNRLVDVDYNFSRSRQGAYSQHGRRQGRSPSPPPQYPTSSHASSNETKAMPVPDLAQDFPSLSGRGASSASASSKSGSSAQLKPANMAHKLAKTTGRNVQSWATSVGNPNLDEQDFPSLGGASQPNHAAPLTSSSNYKASVAAKSKPPATKEVKGGKPAQDFPALPSNSNPMHSFGAPVYRNIAGHTPAWGSNSSSQKPTSNPASSSKKAVAPAPDLDYPSLGRPSSSMLTTKANGGSSKSKNKGKSESIQSGAANSLKGNANLKSAADLIFSEKKAPPSRPKFRPQPEDDELVDSSRPLLPEDDFSSVEAKLAFMNFQGTPQVESAIKVVTQLPPKTRPPGFGPPGFAKHAKQTNLVPKKFTYLEPPEFSTRNKKLMGAITEALGGGKSIELSTFKNLSVRFKASEVNATDFIDEWCELVNDPKRIEVVLPELIALLPDIQKQRMLMEAYEKKNPKSNLPFKLIPCDKCGQLLRTEDMRIHNDSHLLDSEFPAL